VRQTIREEYDELPEIYDGDSEKVERTFQSMLSGSPARLLPRQTEPISKPPEFMAYFACNFNHLLSLLIYGVASLLCILYTEKHY
jgi:hypothetical protein